MKTATSNIGTRTNTATSESDFTWCQDSIIGAVMEKAGLPDTPELSPDKDGFIQLLANIESVFQKLGVNLEIRDVFWEPPGEHFIFPRIRYSLVLNGEEF